MANCHELFQRYNKEIKLSDEKRTVLLTLRESLRQRMKLNFQNIPSFERKNLGLDFQTQGSFVMDTIIRPLNDDYDLDDGVYFHDGISKSERPSPRVFHEWVVRSVNTDNTYERVTDKPTCVRVHYKQGFHIDLPIYYADDFDSPDLAHTKMGWILSNPIEFIAWFEAKTKSGFEKRFINESLKYAEPFEKWLTDIRKQDCQLRKLVRYMKAWADLKKNEMPAGIIMSILVANNYTTNDRDDVALRNTLNNIKTYLVNNGIKCPRPTTPVGEDLFATSSEAEKKYFMNALDGFLNSANTAIETSNEQVARQEWGKHLGNRFLSNGIQSVPVKIEPNLEALKRTAAISTPWAPKD
jgi:hypothetical protein